LVATNKNDEENFKIQEEYFFMLATVNSNGNEIFVAIWVREPTVILPEANCCLLTLAFSIAEADICSQITNCFNVEF
jgi:hypothetical protein